MKDITAREAERTAYRVGSWKRNSETEYKDLEEAAKIAKEKAANAPNDFITLTKVTWNGNRIMTTETVRVNADGTHTKL